MASIRNAIKDYLPEIDGHLARLVEGTGLLQGGVSDYALALLIALLFPIARYILDKTLYDWIARRAINFPKYKKSDEPVTEEMLDTLEKFKESAYKCGVQIVFTIFLLIVALPKDWFVNSLLFWEGCKQLPCMLEPSLGERFVYCLELGFYVQAVPMLFLWETKRKDRWEVFAHHVATIVLIAYSYWLRLIHVGVMVLVCHEANDIFLELAKMARYAKARDSITTGIFVTFMLSWFVTRMYYFLFYIIYSCVFEGTAYAAANNISIQPHHNILTTFLLFLYCLHIYWSYLIVRIAVRQLVHGDAEDIREADHPPVEEAKKRYHSTTSPQHKHAQSVGSMPSNI